MLQELRIPLPFFLTGAHGIDLGNGYVLGVNLEKQDRRRREIDLPAADESPKFGKANNNTSVILNLKQIGWSGSEISAGIGDEIIPTNLPNDQVLSIFTQEVKLANPLNDTEDPKKDVILVSLEGGTIINEKHHI